MFLYPKTFQRLGVVLPPLRVQQGFCWLSLSVAEGFIPIQKLFSIISVLNITSRCLRKKSTSKVIWRSSLRASCIQIFKRNYPFIWSSERRENKLHQPTEDPELRAMGWASPSWDAFHIIPLFPTKSQPVNWNVAMNEMLPVNQLDATSLYVHISSNRHHQPCQLRFNMT